MSGLIELGRFYVACPFLFWGEVLRLPGTAVREVGFALYGKRVAR